MIYKYICEKCNEEFFNEDENSNGTINFEVQYYNGGCGFTEAVEGVLNSLKE